eukprot:CAMPEP_0167793860 /NCGR_PEP_ID=MMETSP0111_2-20121227/13468_1 /TAXON_ID=91324 /ORGANISM="Lotharella globosa, Strain CCCM811" /LENGTH=124 /DNA_ID=CAMNT_0007687171 /DNA_START=117 /DNA_END=491 /DNA_ORIENTATION=-
MVEDRVSIPEHLKDEQKKIEYLRSIEALSPSSKHKAEEKVSSGLMAQMKKLEELQKPFSRDSDTGMRYSVDSTGSADVRPRGDSAVFDEKQLEFVKQQTSQIQEQKKANKATTANGNISECSVQ